MNKTLDHLFRTSSFTSIGHDTNIIELSDLYLNSLRNIKECEKIPENTRTLVIVPGYSVSTPPRIGQHQQYINALLFNPKNNPLGYKKIFLFDIYSKKDGRCNFKSDIPQLAQELYTSIRNGKDGWKFDYNGEVDFIGASMGGLIVRKMINDFIKKDDKLHTKISGKLKIKNVLLIATPNFGCKIIDILQNPIIQFIMRILYGKKNFSKSQQFLQIREGNKFVFGPLIRSVFKQKTTENDFLISLNTSDHTPGEIRWITIVGTKGISLTKLIFRKNLNDGVVEAEKVMIKNAENICDSDVLDKPHWNHRDLYMAPNLCRLLFGLLVLQLELPQYNALLAKKLGLQSQERIVEKYSKNRVNFLSVKKTPRIYPKKKHEKFVALKI